jgi:hypothetical protein
LKRFRELAAREFIRPDTVEFGKIPAGAIKMISNFNLCAIIKIQNEQKYGAPVRKKVS